MSLDFERAHSFVETWEGGFVDDKADPGGATKWGVALRTIIAKGLDFNNDGVIDRRDILDMTPAQARQLYRQDYWEGARCPDLPAPLALVHYDCAVNQGVGRAARILQTAAGVKADGKIGPQTLAAVKSRWASQPSLIIREYCARRAVHYSSLAIVVRFGLGWFRRLFAAQEAALRQLWG